MFASRKRAISGVAAGLGAAALSLAAVGCGGGKKAVALAGNVATPCQGMLFEANVRSGPDRGTALIGSLSLRADSSGVLHGTLVRLPKDGPALPVSGHVSGRSLALSFALGGGQTVSGSGQGARTIVRCSDFSGGSLQGPRAGDTGDWAVAVSAPAEAARRESSAEARREAEPRTEYTIYGREAERLKAE
jgi:hypothetical protein